MNQSETAQYYRNSSTARWIGLFVIALASAQSALTLSSIQIAIPTIVNELRASAVLVSWIPMSFLLVNAIAILPMGRIADAVGRKKIFLLGMIIFGIANFVAAQVQSIEWLLICRGLQGLGAAMTHACGMAIVIGIVTPEKRGSALGMTASAVYMGLACGPLVGGFLTEHFGWRSVFMAQVPFTLICIVLMMRFLKGEWQGAEKLSLDWAGLFLLAGFLCCLVFGLTNITSQSGQLLFCAGALLGVIFFRHQLRAANPLVRIKAIQGNVVFSAALFTSFFVYAGNYTVVFLMSLLLQFIMSLSPSEAGLLVVVPALTVALVSPLAGRLSSHFTATRLTAIGCFVVSLAFLLLCFIQKDSSWGFVLTALLLNGLGMGLFTAPNNSAAMGAVSAERLGAASAVLNLARYLGNMLGTSVVLLLMGVLIGAQGLGEENLNELLLVVRGAFGFAVVATLSATLFAYRASLVGLKG